MLSIVGSASRRELVEGIVPRSIARSTPMAIPAPVTEAAALKQLKAIAAKNQVFKNFIGQGYYGTCTPGVILRNILENPAWYTAYTPYQAEISAGPHGGADQLPDHGLRPDRHADRQRLHARRGHRRRRSHDPGQAQRQEQEQCLHRGRRLPSADH